MTIKALTSGQDGVYANQLLLIKEMGEKYPGLLEILMDPNGSLYLNEGMYEKAIEFIEERMEKNGGSMEIIQMYGKDNLEGELILAALDRLMVDCDAKRFDRFMEGLETKAIQYGRETAEGWDKNYLNAAMIKLMREDSKATAERIATNRAYRFMEETKRYSAIAAEIMNNAAYMAVIYSAVLKAEVKGKTVGGEGGKGEKGAGRVNNAPKIKDAKFNKGKSGALEESGKIANTPNFDTTRINIANGPTRFSPSNKAGLGHVQERHFSPGKNAGQFSISVDELKSILGSKDVVNTVGTISQESGQYVRIVDVGKDIGTIKPSIPEVGGQNTSWIAVYTDVKGNLITTYPVPAPH